MINNEKLTAWAYDRLSDAIYNKDAGTVRSLLEIGLDPNAKLKNCGGWTLLMHAVCCGGWTLLMHAVCGGDFATIDALLKAGADVNAVLVDEVTGSKQTLFDLIDESKGPRLQGGLYSEHAEAVKNFIVNHIVNTKTCRGCHNIATSFNEAVVQDDCRKCEALIHE